MRAPRVHARSSLATTLLVGSLALSCGSTTPVGAEGAPVAPTERPDKPAQPPGPPPAPTFSLSKTARLWSTSMTTPVFTRPDRSAQKLGYLRLGASVPRSDRALGGVGCRGEWFGVSPGGFVCVATPSVGAPPAKGEPPDEATLDPKSPLLHALTRLPDLSKPMPYPYAFVRAATALYLQVPTKKDQDHWEFGLKNHLKSYSAHRATWNDVETGGANAVPLDPKGLPLTPPDADPPPAPDTHDERAVFGGGESDELPSWLHLRPADPVKGRFDRDIPNVSPFVAPPYAIYGGRIARHAGVALASTFVAPDEAGKRRFAVTLDGRLLPTDKLKPHYASSFHGVAIDGQKVRLPFAFVKTEHAHFRAPSDAGPRWASVGDASYRSVVNLTGKERKYETARYLEATDGRWLEVSDVAYVDRPSPMPPEFDWKSTKWIDVNIWHQTLVAYEGDTPVYATLVSTGIDGMGDPKTTKSTIRGAFRIDTKHVTTTMDADDLENKFELRDVPWVQFFEQGYALHAAYWHDDFGKPRSHGCVNLSPIDAHYLFFWTDPPLPAGWHGATATGNLGKGTWVRVRAM